MFAHPILSGRQFGSDCMSFTITALTPGIGLSSILSCIDLSLIEIGRLRVDTSFIHVELIDFYGVPVVKVSP